MILIGGIEEIGDEETFSRNCVHDDNVQGYDDDDDDDDGLNICTFDRPEFHYFGEQMLNIQPSADDDDDDDDDDDGDGDGGDDDDEMRESKILHFNRIQAGTVRSNAQCKSFSAQLAASDTRGFATSAVTGQSDRHPATTSRWMLNITSPCSLSARLWAGEAVFD